MSEDCLETQAEELQAQLDISTSDELKASTLQQLHVVEERLVRHRSSRRSNQQQPIQPQVTDHAAQVVIDDQQVQLRSKDGSRPRRQTFRRLPTMQLEGSRTEALRRLSRQSVAFSRKSSLYGFGFDIDGASSRSSLASITGYTGREAGAPSPPPLPRMSTIVTAHDTYGWQRR